MVKETSLSMDPILEQIKPGAPLPPAFYRMTALEAAPFYLGRRSFAARKKAISAAVSWKPKATAAWRIRGVTLMADAGRRGRRSCLALAGQPIFI